MNNDKISSEEKLRLLRRGVGVYLDYAATTPLDPRVKEAMEPYWEEEYGNPSSLHKKGRRAKEALDKARSTIAGILNCRAEEIIFTGGGTEALNLAVFGSTANVFAVDGVASLDSRSETSVNESEPGGSSGRRTKRDYTRRDLPLTQGGDLSNPPIKISIDSPLSSRINRASFFPTGHIIISKIEHHAVLRPIEALGKEGWEVTYLDVDEYGLINPEDVKKALRPDTVLVSVMYANNEIGTIEPIVEIAKVIRDSGNKAVFLTDACQAAGALDMDTQKLGVDLLAFNGSKIYGPKGIGCLYVKKGIKLRPLILGGGQERGLRSGTENIPAIIGLAKALELAQKERGTENKRLIDLRDFFINKALKCAPKIILNGHSTKRLPNNINISVLGVEGEALTLYLDNEGIYVSTGSACTSASLESSHVLLALGRSHEEAHGSLRFTLGRKTTKEDLEYVLEILPGVIEKLRKISAIKI